MHSYHNKSSPAGNPAGHSYGLLLSPHVEPSEESHEQPDKG